MTLPTKVVTLPAIIRPYHNGELPATALVVLPRPDPTAPAVTLCPPAARAWWALNHAHHGETGVWLASTGPADSYRSLAQQEDLFRARYTTTPLAGRPSKVWAGQQWWLREGMAAAAVPGTSNHGYGCAIDVANVDNHLAWLHANADAYGFTWELQSEPWHLDYYRGDNIPTAVITSEGGTVTTPTDHDWILWMKDRVGGTFDAVARIEQMLKDADARTAPTIDADALADKVATRLQGQWTGAEVSDIKAAVKAALREGTGPDTP